MGKTVSVNTGALEFMYQDRYLNMVVRCVFYIPGKSAKVKGSHAMLLSASMVGFG